MSIPVEVRAYGKYELMLLRKTDESPDVIGDLMTAVIEKGIVTTTGEPSWAHSPG